MPAFVDSSTIKNIAQRAGLEKGLAGLKPATSESIDNFNLSRPMGKGKRVG